MTEGSVREPLNRARVLRAALELADRDGLAALTMRSLAAALGVKPMSLYHHVANKEALLDAIVDQVFAEIELPRPGLDWRAELGRRARSTRSVLGRHPWAVGLLETRTTPGEATLRHHNAVIGTLREAGFPWPALAHAMAVLDAFVMGFVVQETTLPFDAATSPEALRELAGDTLAGRSMADFAHLVAFMTDHVLRPGYELGSSFEVGLEILLDGLDRLREA